MKPGRSLNAIGSCCLGAQQVAEVVAAVKGVTLEEVKAAAYQNTVKVFFPHGLPA
jgi:hypothetical protein